MKTILRISTLLAAAMWAGTSHAATRASAGYALAADHLGAGGSAAATADYSQQGAIGGIATITHAGRQAATAKPGFIGQLYEFTSLALSVEDGAANEGTACQFAARATLDDDSTLDLEPWELGWTLDPGPIGPIDRAGKAAVEHVYQDTPAFVEGSYLGLDARFELRVINTGNDDYAAYARDGLDDAWQVRHFGENHPAAGPTADADGDGQPNAEEYVVGSVPTDPDSRFRLRVEAVPGQPTWKHVIFSPRLPDRTYTVQYKLDLGSPGFAKLDGFSVSDAGVERTVTDLNAVEPHRFYRVQITWP